MQAIEIMAQSKNSGSGHRDNSGEKSGANSAGNGIVDGAASDAASSLSSMGELAGMLDNHKGKLAIGVAATLGLMVFYSWREKKLAKEDPEAHAMHQKSKAIVKAAESMASRAHGAASDTRSDTRSNSGPGRIDKDALPR